MGKGCVVVLLLALASAASAQTSLGVFGGPAFFTVAGGDSDANLGPAVGVALDVMLSKKVALALTGGAGVRYGSGRVWGFLEARYSWGPHGGRGDFVTAPASSMPPLPGGGSSYSSASPSYRGVVIVGAVMLRLGSR